MVPEMEWVVDALTGSVWKFIAHLLSPKLVFSQFGLF